MSLSKVKSLFNDGQMEEALEVLNEIRKHYGPDHPDYFDVLLLKGQIFLNLSYYDRGETLMNTLIDMARRKRNQIAKLDAVILMAKIAFSRGNLEQLILMIEMGEIDFTKLGEDISNEEKAHRYSQLKYLKGVYHRYTGENDLAMEYFNEALIEAELSHSDQLIGSIYNMIGVVYFETGDLNLSWNNYIRSYDLVKTDVPNLQYATVLFNIACVQQRIGELKPAEESLNNALDLAKTIQNKRLIGHILGYLGKNEAYYGNMDRGFSYLTEALKLKEEQGNSVEIAWVLYQIINLIMSSEKSELAPIFIDGLEDLYKRNPSNDIIKTNYLIIKANRLKNANKTIERAEAQKIYYDLIGNEVVDYSISIEAMINLSDILFEEFKQTTDPEILEELELIIRRIANYAEQQGSLILLIRLYQIQARYATMELDFKLALELINQSVEIIEEKNIKSLEPQVGELHDRILERMGEISDDEISDAYRIKKVEQSDMQRRMAEVIEKHGSKPELFSPNPLIFLLIDEESEVFYSHSFTSGGDEDHHLIKSSIKAINNLIQSNFSSAAPVERIKHGSNTILTKDVEGFIAVYIIEGDYSYHAIKQLEIVVQKLKKEPNLIKSLRNRSFDIHSFDQLLLGSLSN